MTYNSHAVHPICARPQACFDKDLLPSRASGPWRLHVSMIISAAEYTILSPFICLTPLSVQVIWVDFIASSEHCRLQAMSTCPSGARAGVGDVVLVSVLTVLGGICLLDGLLDLTGSVVDRPHDANMGHSPPCWDFHRRCSLLLNLCLLTE